MTKMRSGELVQKGCVYNDEKGEEDFSEGEQEIVEQNNVVDDGVVVLSETQLQEASVATLDQALGSAPSTSFATAADVRSHLDNVFGSTLTKLRKRPDLIDSDESDDSHESESEDVAPATLLLRGVGASSSSATQQPKAIRCAAKPKVPSRVSSSS